MTSDGEPDAPPPPAKSPPPGPPPGGAVWSEAPGLIGRGFCMGLAEVVPGVSGGTIALITGVYTRLVLAINSIDATAVGHLAGRRLRALLDHVGWRFLLLLGGGQAAGIVLFSKRMPAWIQAYPERVYGVFFGLIVGSVFLLGRDVLRRGVDRTLVIAAAAGLAVGLLIVTQVPAATPDAPWFLFLSGAIAISAMILPGISGSFVLLLLRKYTAVLSAVGAVTHLGAGGDRWTPLITVVVPFGLGCLVGILGFTRILARLLARAERATLSFMIGLMAGSLWVIWPFQERVFQVIRGKQVMTESHPRWPEAWTGEVTAAIALGVVGLIGVVVLDAVARRVAPPTEAS